MDYLNLVAIEIWEDALRNKKELNIPDHYDHLYVACEAHRRIYYRKDGLKSHYKAYWPTRVKKWTGLSLSDTLDMGKNKARLTLASASLLCKPTAFANALRRTYLHGH